jgi:hypothetical protein
VASRSVVSLRELPPCLPLFPSTCTPSIWTCGACLAPLDWEGDGEGDTTPFFCVAEGLIVVCCGLLEDDGVEIIFFGLVALIFLASASFLGSVIFEHC